MKIIVLNTLCTLQTLGIHAKYKTAKQAMALRLTKLLN